MRSNKLLIKLMIILFLFIFLPLSSAVGFTWKADEVRAISINEKITILSFSSKGKETLTSLKDKRGNIFNVISTEPLKKNTAGNILKLKDRFFSWPGLKIDKIKFVLSKKGMDISILPLKFSYNKINLMPHLPAGIFFIYTDSLHYNFRIKKDNFFIKIRGYFTGETELCKKIAEVIRDPEEYLKNHDPEYIFSQIQKMQNDMDELKKENDKLRWAIIVLTTDKKISRGIIERVLAIRKKFPSASINQIRLTLAKQKIKLTNDQINAILTVYLNKWSDI